MTSHFAWIVSVLYAYIKVTRRHPQGKVHFEPFSHIITSFNTDFNVRGLTCLQIPFSSTVILNLHHPKALWITVQFLRSSPNQSIISIFYHPSKFKFNILNSLSLTSKQLNYQTPYVSTFSCYNSISLFSIKTIATKELDNWILFYCKKNIFLMLGSVW